jgi:hypothetical protein
LVEGKGGKVYFESDAERQSKSETYIEPGIWLWANLPYYSFDKNIDARNRFTVSNQNVYFPPINPEGAIGYDPINYHKEQTTSRSLSRAAIVVKKKFDYFLKEDDPNYFADGIMGVCIFRPDDPHDANKEAMKACRFTGFCCMHERSVDHVYDDFNDAGMLPFLLKDSNGVHGISPSDLKAKKDGLAMLQTRYAAPKEENQIDQLATYPFEDGLVDLDNFDIGNTNPFDFTMGEIYAEHGLKQIVYTNRTENEQNRISKFLSELIPTRR